MPLPINLETIAKDKTKFQQLMLQYAYQLFMYNILKELDIAYNDVFSEIGRLLDPPKVPSSQYQLVFNALAEGLMIQKRLKDRVDKGQSSLRLRQINKDFYLFELYTPAFPVRPVSSSSYMTQLPYKYYPVAQVNYYNAQWLSNPNKQTIPFGRLNFVSGN